MSFPFGAFEPMRCVSAKEAFDDARFRFEPKLDGVRVVAYADGRGGVRLRTRSGREVTRTYPEVAAAIARALEGRAAVLDGEVCVLDARGVPDFHALLQRESVRDPARAARRSVEAPAVYYAFDLLALGDAALTGMPLEARREALRKVAPDDSEGFRVVDFLPGGGRAAFDAASRLGYEGVVAKRAGSPYRPGARSPDWVKVKRVRTADLVVGAWLPGKNALAGSLGALVLGAYDARGALRFVGSVGTGLSLGERRALLDAVSALATEASPFADRVPAEARFVRPVLVVEVAFMEVTGDGKLRAPTFRSVRSDKHPRECLVATELGSGSVVEAAGEEGGEAST